MRSTTTRREGNHAEDIAAQYLQQQGMTVRARNFYFGRVGEIDIIADDGETLVFVEVKARRTASYGSPEAAVTPTKQKVLRRAAEGYLYINNITNRECRFDVIAIRWDNATPEIRHIRNAL